MDDRITWYRMYECDACGYASSDYEEVKNHVETCVHW